MFRRKCEKKLAEVEKHGKKRAKAMKKTMTAMKTMRAMKRKTK